MSSWFFTWHKILLGMIDCQLAWPMEGCIAGLPNSWPAGLASEAVLCGPQRLFARLSSLWKGLPFCGK